MYKYIKDVLIEEYLPLLFTAKWKEVKSDDRLFYTHMFDLPGFNRAFFLKIPAKGKVHRHTDTKRTENTYHVPITTNDKCFSYTYNPDTKTHLKVGKLYSIDRQIEHESVNNGDSDRIHLILETNELLS